MGRNFLLYWAAAAAIALLMFFGPGCAHDRAESKVHAATPVAVDEGATSDVDHAATEPHLEATGTGGAGEQAAGDEEDTVRDTDAPIPQTPHTIYQQNGDRLADPSLEGGVR